MKGAPAERKGVEESCVRSSHIRSVTGDAPCPPTTPHPVEGWRFTPWTR